MPMLRLLKVFVLVLLVSGCASHAPEIDNAQAAVDAQHEYYNTVIDLEQQKLKQMEELNKQNKLILEEYKKVIAP